MSATCHRGHRNQSKGVTRKRSLGLLREAPGVRRKQEPGCRDGAKTVVKRTRTNLYLAEAKVPVNESDLKQREKQVSGPPARPAARASLPNSLSEQRGVHQDHACVVNAPEHAAPRPSLCPRPRNVAASRPGEQHPSLALAVRGGVRADSIQTVMRGVPPSWSARGRSKTPGHGGFRGRTTNRTDHPLAACPSTLGRFRVSFFWFLEFQNNVRSSPPKFPEPWLLHLPSEDKNRVAVEIKSVNRWHRACHSAGSSRP